MQGIAEGSGIPFQQIVQLNVPAYFMTGEFAQECSMILVRSAASEDGKTYIIKNRDMRAPVRQMLIYRSYSDGSRIAEVSGIGTVTYPASGINSRGLAVTTTGFWSPKVKPDISAAGSSQIFLNIHLLLRKASTVREALELLHKMPVMNGLNLILADGKEACAVEMTANNQYIEWDQGDGILYRTNHYISPELVHLNPEYKEYTSTYFRRERIGKLLADYYGHVRFQDLMRIASDHRNGVNSICRHPHGDVHAQTVSTTLMIVEDQEIWTTLTNPCEAMPHFEL